MKKYLLILLGAFLINNLSAQKFKGSIRQTATTGQSKSFKVYLRPDAAFNQQFSNLVFVVQIPSTVTPIPTLSVIENNLSTTFPTGFTVSPVPVVSGGYYNYRIAATSVAAPATSIASGAEFYVMTMAFSNGPSSDTEVRFANLPGGGPGSLYQFYVEGAGNDYTNYGQMFYGTNTVPATPYGDETVGYNSYQYQPIAGILLPTKFLSFYANKSDDNAKLTWTVDNEEANNYFEIEASTDGRTFKTVQKVDALHNGRSSNTYNTTDSRISRYNSGTVYYRIKQFEADGKYIYSDVRQVTLDSKNFVAALYPNPVKTVTKLVIEAPEAGKATVIIRDATGKAVKQMNLQLQKGTNQQELDASVLPAGDYNVTIVSDKLNQTIKMTKSN